MLRDRDRLQPRLDRTPATGRGPKAHPLSFEPLEGRRLLSGYNPTYQHVTYNHQTFGIQLTGPGQVHVRQTSNGRYNIIINGSNESTSVSVTEVSTSAKAVSTLLPVQSIDVTSGQVGQIFGSGAINLLGTFNVNSPVQTLDLGAVGPKATIAVPSIGALDVTGAIELGVGGSIHIEGDVTTGFEAGSITLVGGSITIDHNVADFLDNGTFTAVSSGIFAIGNNLTASDIAGATYLSTGGLFRVGLDATSLNFGADVTLAPGGQIFVARDVLQPVTINGSLAINAGQFYVGRDVTGGFTINGALAGLNGGNLDVGRDIAGGLTVNGNVGLGGGGALLIGRNLGTQANTGIAGSTSSTAPTTPTSPSATAAPITGADANSTGLTVNGNIMTAGVGTISVGGNLNALRVSGVMLGMGSSAVDLTVGLDLNNFAVSGGLNNLGSVSHFNISVGKNISGISVLHGFFDDFITAGVLITNGNVGPDGPIAVFDTEIRAGVQITNVTFNGDVESDRPTNPTALRTRIIAGEDRQGNWTIGGNMISVIVTGTLQDAVLAASVQPYGGNGSTTVTPSPAPAPGQLDYYDAPGSNPFGGSSNVGLPFAAPPFNTTTDPNVHDTVLPGSINHNFAQQQPSPAIVANPDGKTETVTTTTVYPTQGTVLGGVFTTAKPAANGVGLVNNADYAGVFAADTTGVFIGNPPPTSSVTKIIPIPGL